MPVVCGRPLTFSDHDVDPKRLLEKLPSEKPLEHTGDASTDFFDTTELSNETLEIIFDHLYQAEAGVVSETGDTTPEASRIGSLADLWHEGYELDTTPITTTSEQGGGAKR